MAANSQFVDWLMSDLMQHQDFKDYVQTQEPISGAMGSSAVKGEYHKSPVNRAFNNTLVLRSNVKTKVKELLKTLALLRCSILAVCQNFVTFDSPQGWTNFSDNARLSSPKSSASDSHFLYILRRQIAVILEDSVLKRWSSSDSTQQCRIIDKLCTAGRATTRLLSICVLRLSKTDLVRIGLHADFATSLRDCLRQLLAALSNLDCLESDELNDLNTTVETFEMEVLLPLQQRKEMLETAAERYLQDLLVSPKGTTPMRSQKLQVYRPDYRPKGFLMPLQASRGLIKTKSPMRRTPGKAPEAPNRLDRVEGLLENVLDRLDHLQLEYAKPVVSNRNITEICHAQSQTDPSKEAEEESVQSGQPSRQQRPLNLQAAKLSNQIVEEVVEDFCLKLDRICDEIVTDIFREEMVPLERAF